MKKTIIAGIYLAAGQSSRFGSSKLLPKIGKLPLGSIALQASLESKLDQVAVITSQTDTLDWVPPHLQRLHNSKWFHAPSSESYRGQAYSIKCGIRFAEKANAEAVIILLADQPLVSKKMINTLINQYEHTRANQKPVPFIASTYAGIPCPPILFMRSMFAELHKLEGDAGARFLIRDRTEEGIFMPFMDALLFFDVDTQEDYQALVKQLNQP